MTSPRKVETFDVLIIGAGAAGLAAAARVATTTRSALVLEARDRVGGRCWTHREPGLAVPVELGAEFIHGAPATTLNELAQAGMATVDVGREHWFRDHDRLKRRAAFASVRNAMRASALLDRRDLAFATYLKRACGTELTPDEVATARRMVEGFDAADPRRISARAVRDEWTDPQAASGVQSRPLGGYGNLMAALARRSTAGKCRLRLHTVVRAVSWTRGRVEVIAETRGRQYTVIAASAIITLPLGVLQQSPARGVRFVPALAAKHDALRALSAGAALKVMMQFRASFWEKIERERYRDAAFFHAWRAPLRTMWTAVPLRAPLLTAWAGGPPAIRLLGHGRPHLIAAALASVQSVFGPRTDVETELENWWLHDWQHDPFARGAYSYVNAGGAGAREELATPLADTLFFAGEATDYAGESGTVAAALGSGVRAAQELIDRTPG